MGDFLSGSVYEAFKTNAEKSPDKIALIYLGKKYTYSQLKEMSEHLARALYKLGIRKQDKVMIYQPHAPQWIIEWLALQRMGAVAVPITHFYGPREIQYIANDSGAETIFCMDTNFGYVTKVLSSTHLKRIVVATMSEVLPWWKKMIGRLYNRIPEGKFNVGENIVTFNSLLQKELPPLPSSLSSKGEEIIELVYTGGTTGFPKGVPLSCAIFLLSTNEQRKASEGVIPRGEDTVIQGAPLFHVLGQEVGIGALLSGDTLVLLPKMFLDAIFDHIERFKITSFFGTPTMYRMVLEHDRVDYYDLSSLKYCFCSGDTLPLEVANKWAKKFGIPICQGYGASETCGGVFMTPAEKAFPERTVGKLVPHWRVMLVHPDTLEPMPPESDEPGELLVSSEQMIRTYWNKPEETAERFVNVDGRVWYKTGDILSIDKDGWAYFQDRSVDLIKHKGYRVAASKVEAVLQENPAVIASCVVGVPDLKVGERIKAFVVLRQDVKGVTAYDLIRWCSERLVYYEVPQYIEFRDMLPKSKVGKLLRREIRSQERRKLEKSQS
jgi:long-chain acyl-CoA synthetase